MARLEQVTVCLATTRVLLGMDFKNIDIVRVATAVDVMDQLLTTVRLLHLVKSLEVQIQRNCQRIFMLTKKNQKLPIFRQFK